MNLALLRVQILKHFGGLNFKLNSTRGLFQFKEHLKAKYVTFRNSFSVVTQLRLSRLHTHARPLTTPVCASTTQSSDTRGEVIDCS